ncbi:oxygen tolerance protein BatD [Gelidibacter sediminis]|uniref:Oxygen tolerance protein BatD n=1 Tax=Gelidibacter sediminis TaxID=1608710 RepID=A0A4R7Q8J1_9FLAO|nr:BatD family protein [Gelidibacter sediminis]TDU43312.1 oxygen tolerance protein BatD [Gelidibacter sediminis]
MKLKTYILLFLIVLSTTLVSAQVKFEAKVSKTQLGINERLRVDFEMNTDGDNFNPPSFADFTVVGGPNQSVSHSWINGVRSFSKTYSYFLAPKKTGSITINQATIEIDGEIYKTSPVTVQITTAVSRPNDPDNVENVADDNVHLIAEISKTNPYLNEAVTVTYKLYVSEDIGVSNFREKSNPRYNDFWSQNIDLKGTQIQKTEFKGRSYRYLVVRKTVLYPQKSGKLEIEPLSLDLTVQVPTKKRDFFGSVLTTEVHKTVSAGSKTLTVKALPENGKPADFSGAVGDFNFTLTTSKTDLNATESLQARVEVTGKGNLKLFQLPKLTIPSALEVYEPEHTENIRTLSEGMQGSIVDNYTIVPQYKGKYPIPNVDFTYFDLKSETYKTISSGQLVVNVLDGPTNNSNSDSHIATTGEGKQRVTMNNDQFAFVKSKANLEPIESKPFFNSSAYWSALLLPLMAIPLAMVFRRKKAQRAADVTGNKIRKADRLAKKYLGFAKKALGQKEAFYIALEKALHNYLKAKLRIETSDLSKDRIQQLLLKRGVDAVVVSDFLSILDSCELARYTPFSEVTMQHDYDKAAKTISVIDKQIR